jgi:hypothetical protein
MRCVPADVDERELAFPAYGFLFSVTVGRMLDAVQSRFDY